MSGAEAIVFLDDDEVVEPEYLDRAREVVTVHPGVGGPYLDIHGFPFLPERTAQKNIFLDKARYMNAALEELLAGGGRKRTPLAFGGNMVLECALAKAVPFDPLIPRGEDIDYVLSAWLLGFEFYFDPGLVVVHLPPTEPRPSPCEALRRDVARFLYQREKLAAAVAQGLSPRVELDPYPGRFLRDDLEAEAAHALSLVCGWEKRKTRDFINRVLAWARAYADSYFKFVQCWQEFTGTLPQYKRILPEENTRGDLPFMCI